MPMREPSQIKILDTIDKAFNHNNEEERGEGVTLANTFGGGEGRAGGDIDQDRKQN